MTTEDGETRNEYSGPAESVVQARDIGAINNNFHEYQPNEDLALVIVCDEGLELSPGDRVSVTVEIHSRKDEPYDVRLHVEGMSDTESMIIPDAVTVAPRGTKKVKLVLCPSATAPEAGRRRVSVRAEDRSGRSVVEDAAVMITSRPDMDVRPHPPADLWASGTYPMVVELENTGNKSLQGNVRAPGEFGEPATHRLDMVDAGSFDLAPGESAHLNLDLQLGLQQPFTTSCTSQLTIDIVRGGMESFQKDVTINQIGWVVQMPERLRIALESAKAGAAGFVEWCGKRPTTRRGALLAAAGVAVVLSAVLAASFSGESAPRADSTGVVATSSSTPSTTPASNPAYSLMACTPGTSAINLWSMTSAEAEAHGAWVVEFESERMQRRLGPEDARFVSRLLDLYGARVNLTKWEDACSPFRGAKRPEAEVFIWFGPLPEGEAGSVCAMLHKDGSIDCTTGSITER